VSRTDNHIIPAGTLVGGFGGGQLAAANAAVKQAIPWSLPKGDRTLVQLQMGTGEDDAPTKGGKQPKHGTFYCIVKPLERKAAEGGASVILTSYGKVIPHGSAGQHGYKFEFPHDTPQHKAQDYIPRLSAGSKITSGNFFASLANRAGWGGVLAPLWRLSHDNVRHILTARKPFVIVAQDVKLEKGKPLKLCWLLP